MSHISYSELKDWVHCAFYHKLTRVDGIDGFKGNAYTAFGSAIHSVCEKKLLQEEISEDFFVNEMKKNIAELDDDIQVDRAVDGRHAGPKTHRNFADLILKEFF